MRCRSCERELADGFRFCPACGSEQGQPCRGCGAPVEAGFAFCPRCGRGTDGPAPERVARPTRSSGGERRVVTVLFADVVGFTSKAEKFDPETLTEMMNLLWERVGAVVRRYEGTIDKFIGDAVMVLFGAPIAHEDHAERAVLASLDLLAVLPAVNAACRARCGVDPGLGLHIGVSTGLVVAGRVGEGSGGGYTVMGDAVNLAARLVELAR